MKRCGRYRGSGRRNWVFIGGLLYQWRGRLDPIDKVSARHRRTRASRHSDRRSPTEAGAGGQDAGGGFFQRCLAKSRGSTPEERRFWRDGIYDQIREVMSIARQLEHRAHV